jgi:hypothetical protein
MSGNEPGTMASRYPGTLVKSTAKCMDEEDVALSEIADIFIQAGCYPRIFQRGTWKAIVQLERILPVEGVAPAAAESSVLLVERVEDVADSRV